MAKRFSRYNFALKAVDGSAPTGTALAKFKEYKSGTVKLNYPQDPTSNPGDFQQLILSPFAAPPDTVYFTQIGTRAKNKIADLLSTVSSLNHLTSSEGAILNRGYVPAKAVVQTGGSGNTTETSKITGVTYQKATGAASYTLPFGAQKSTGENRFYLNVIGNIKTAVEAKSSAYGVSFQPERFTL